ncbi:MAG: AFG1 family ATPase [Gammaproteobacteria bacterium]|nr:AFG1 family ATPase [Gammaproteobacteria bacterium]
MPRTRTTRIEAAYSKALDTQRIVPDPGQMEALEALARLERELSRTPRFRRRRSICGVYLHGPVGRGKTWLMDLFFRNLPIRGKLRAHFHVFMQQEMHAPLKKLKRQRDPLQKLARAIARKTRVICFDELLVEDITDAMLLGPLFEALFAEGVALVATANLPPGKLYRDGLQRERFLPAISAIERHCEIVHVAGKLDHRAEQIGANGTWRLLGRPAASADLHGLFRRLTDVPPSAGELRINDRPVRYLGAGADSLFMDFEALCAGARNASDYLELARRYRILMIADIPTLDDENLDTVRRFIALVDVLYEAHTVVIVSAAAAPAELYRGKRFRFEYRRTTSRLEEMRSANWLAAAHLAHAPALTPL